MGYELLIKNGKIVSSDSVYKGNIYVKNGKIAAITDDELLTEVMEVIDADNLHIFPGFIDTHVHSRDPGATYKEDFFHSTKAAAIGGITTIFEMPNTNPPINNAANLKKQIVNLQGKAFIDFGIWGICLGHLNSREYQGLHNSGVIGFKFFWGYAIHSETYQLIYNFKQGMKNVIPPFTDGQVYEIFKEVEKTGQILAIHAENNDLIQYLSEQGEQRKGRTYKDLLECRPNLAEELTIQTGIAMAKKTGVRLHLLHVSTEEGIEHIRQAQKEGYPITAETCPHYLFLSDEDYERIGPQMKVYPLVKYKKDQIALWNAILDGTISIVCSDHAPHTEDEKDGDLWEIPAGMCGVETLVPLMLNAVNEGRITVQQVVQLLSEEPAKLFGIYPTKGAIRVGSDADFTIVNMNKETIIKKENLHSKSKVTAFDGFKVKGVPVQTILRGRSIMRNGEIIGETTGEFIAPINN